MFDRLKCLGYLLVCLIGLEHIFVIDPSLLPKESTPNISYWYCPTMFCARASFAHSVSFPQVNVTSHHPMPYHVNADNLQTVQVNQTQPISISFPDTTLCFQSVGAWMTQNKLKLNDVKTEIKEKIVSANNLSRLFYCNSLFSGFSNNKIIQLEFTQNTAARI